MNTRQLATRYFAVALAVAVTLPIGGCATFFAGKSTFGDNALVSADLPPIATDTLDGNLENARNHFRNNDFGYAAAYYKQAVDMSPGNVEAYFGLAASYDNLQRFDLADRVYGQLLKLTDGSAQYYNNMGYSYLLRGNNRQALSSFERAHSLDPENETVASNIQMLSAGSDPLAGQPG